MNKVLQTANRIPIGGLVCKLLSAGAPFPLALLGGNVCAGVYSNRKSGLGNNVNSNSVRKYALKCVLEHAVANAHAKTQ